MVAGNHSNTLIGAEHRRPEPLDCGADRCGIVEGRPTNDHHRMVGIGEHLAHDGIRVGQIRKQPISGRCGIVERRFMRPG